ncbi:hypothetical protein NL676_025636 [Syzygium grande]|nr:hypothetical protein NL676_025636 [Syzygium grande]
MANNPNEGPADEFLEHLLDLPNFAAMESCLAPGDGSGLSMITATLMMLQIASSDGSGNISTLGGGGFHEAVFPLG